MDDVRESLMEGGEVVSSRAKYLYKDFLCKLWAVGAVVELKKSVFKRFLEGTMSWR